MLLAGVPTPLMAAKANPAGYSGTPLVKKLGLKDGMRVAFLHAPPGLVESLDMPEVKMAARTGECDFIMLFATTAAGYKIDFAGAKQRLAKDGMIWVAWPKKASGVQTDVTFDVVQQTGLKGGLVDVKVCAVDETWSGLKFMYRKKDR